MKMVSKLALATMLSLGALSLGAAPAVAQKGKKDEKAAPVDPNEASVARISAEYRKPAGAAEAAIKAKDWATAETQLALAEAAAKNDDERYYAAGMRLQIEANKPNNLEAIIKVLDSLIANPRSPKANLPLYNFLRGDSTFKLKRRAEALPFLIKARDLGYVPRGAPSDLQIMIAQAYFDANDLKTGAAEMEKAIAAERAAGNKPSESWYNFVFARFYKAKDSAEAAKWAVMWLKEYPTTENWRRLIVNYRNGRIDAGAAAFSRGERIDLFRLLRGTHALADQNDYLEYASYAAAAGLPWEAVAVIGEARAAGKIPEGDTKFSAILAPAQTKVKEEGSLDAEARAAAAAPTGKEALGTGDAYLSSDNYAKALELYDLALTKGSVDTNAVNLHRGVALFHLGRKPEAREAFAKVAGAPLSEIANFWITWIDLPTPPAA